MDIKELETMYNKTIKNLNELSLDELRDLIKEKRSILSGIEYNIALQKTKGNLSRLIDLQNKFSERWLEDFQDPFWDELRIKKAQKEFQEKIAEFQKDLKNVKDIYEIEYLLDAFYDSFKWTQNNCLEMTLWNELYNEEIFDKKNLMSFIEILDKYKDYLICQLTTT